MRASKAERAAWIVEYLAETASYNRAAGRYRHDRRLGCTPTYDDELDFVDAYAEAFPGSNPDPSLKLASRRLRLPQLCGAPHSWGNFRIGINLATVAAAVGEPKEDPPSGTDQHIAEPAWESARCRAPAVPLRQTMATGAEKQDRETSAQQALAEEAAQRKDFRNQEAAIRKGLRRLSRRTRVVNARKLQWTMPMAGLAGVYLWWDGSLRLIEDIAVEIGLPAAAVPISAVLVAIGAAGWLQERSKEAADNLAYDRFEFLKDARQTAHNHLTHPGEDTTNRKRRGAQLFRLLAEHGDALAQIQTGILHAEQIGTVHNPVEAVRWFRCAAKLKHAGAMQRLGDCYVRGLGVKRNYGEAIRWYWNAATEGWHSANKWSVDGITGSPLALWNLGYMYATGMGVEKDLAEARRHYSNAATDHREVDEHFAFESWWDIGTHREAYRGIGKACRLTGLDEEAAFWLGWAASEGDDEARKECADLVTHGAAWLRKAAEGEMDEEHDFHGRYADHGDPKAQIELGHLYVQGRGVPQDPETGEKWYRTAIEYYQGQLFGFSDALVGAPDNIDEAVKWLRAKAEEERADSISWWRWVDARAALRRLHRDSTSTGTQMKPPDSGPQAG